MPRTRVPPNGEFPYHVSGRCINKQWFDLPMPDVWSIFEDFLGLIASEFDVKIHLFVLMSNHFHLVVSTPRSNLGPAMRYLMRETSREFSRYSGRINQHYGGRFHRTLISNYHYFMNVYKYVYRNPVRAHLCGRVEDYRYSTLNGLCGASSLFIPLAEDTLLFEPEISQSLVDWLNTPSKSEHEEEMRKALRKSELRFTKNRKTGRVSCLVDGLI